MTRHPDAHYRGVAVLYREVMYRTPIGTHSNAGETIARQYQVPLTTAYRWIKEARLRGLLEPAAAFRAQHCPTCGAYPSKWEPLHLAGTPDAETTP